jgi:hypothetical protein
MDAHLGAAQTAEPAFRFIRARPLVAFELAGVIDAQHRIGRVQRIPGARLVGMNRGAARYVSADQRDRSALPRHDEWQGTSQDLAGDNDHLALAGLFLGRAAIGAVNFAIRRFNLTAKIGRRRSRPCRPTQADLDCGSRCRALRAACARARKPSCIGSRDPG